MNNNTQYEYLIKLVLIGSAGCGKTNFLSKVCRNQFNLEQKATVGVEFGQRDMIIDATAIRVQIWDTAGQEKFGSMTSQYFRNACGVFLIYEITNRESFEKMKMWLDIVQKNVSEFTTIFLVGNKLDLTNLREVSFEEGQAFAMSNGLLFGECSSATSENLEDVIKRMMARVFFVMQRDDVQLNNPINRASITTARSQATNNPCC